MQMMNTNQTIKVLIIDDDVLITGLLTKMMEFAGFEAYAENSGLAGVEAVRRLNPDVVVLDLMMPGMSGWDVCKEIRTFSQVPVLVLSAVTDSQLVMQSLENGANGYLVKPVPEKVLVSHIRELLGRTR